MAPALTWARARAGDNMSRLSMSDRSRWWLFLAEAVIATGQALGRVPCEDLKTQMQEYLELTGLLSLALCDTSLHIRTAHQTIACSTCKRSAQAVATNCA